MLTLYILHGRPSVTCIAEQSGQITFLIKRLPYPFLAIVYVYYPGCILKNGECVSH